MVGRTPSRKRELIHDGDLIPDNRLSPGDADLLEHDALARSVAEIALTAQTPTNIALFGAWGSGKSSIYSMITKHLGKIAGDEVQVARYDAWKYGGQDLKRNFIHSVAADLGHGNVPDFAEGLENEQSKARLDVLRWLKNNQKSLWTGLGVAMLVAVVWMTVLLGVSVILGRSAFVDAARALIPQAGTVFGLSLVAVIVGPQVLQGAVVTTKTPAPAGADQFATRFSNLVDKVRSGRTRRLVVFIDELDRCSPDDVVATLVDLKTFLDQDGCTFIVAADREVIEQSLRRVPQAKPVREDEPYYATPGAFLDKIFQHQIALPPLRSRALTQFAHNLVREQDGLWQQLRDSGPDTFELAVFALVPVHVRSPRRVKILLNNFATNARIAEARGMTWLDRAHEIAILTVLQTEFPAVADELRRVPRLLVYLRGEETSEADEVKTLVQRFRDSAPVTDDANDAEQKDGVEPSETPAGTLLSDDTTAAGAHKRRDADRALRHHLSMYLSKVHAASITDPRPDLLYLQAAGSGDSLGDPQLGDVIDFATDTAPDTVVEAFAGKDPRILAIAVPLLVTEGDNSYGPGRKFAYEAACRLIELIDDGDDSSRESVVRGASPSLVAAITGNALTPSSMPGALLAACWTGQADVVTTALGAVQATEVEDDLLGRLALLFPHLHQDGAKVLSTLLAEAFEQRPDPLIDAMTALPTDSAVSLWASAASPVLAALKRMELPPAPDSTESASTAAAGGASTVPASTNPAPTGEGVARIETLIKSVQTRPEHEELMSAVLVSAQSWGSCDPIRSWVLNNTDSLIATMASASRRAQHALLGLWYSPQHDWVSWAAFLPDDGEHFVSEVVAELAGEVLTDRLLPAVTKADASIRSALPAAVARVHALAETDGPALVEAITAVATAVKWVDMNPDQPAAVEVWERKKTTVDVAVTLANHAGAEVLDPVVNDLVVALEECSLSSTFVVQWLGMATTLPHSAARALSERSDQYEYQEAEKTAAVKLKLGVRRVFDGDPLPASDLGEIPEGKADTAMTGVWLSLSPPPDDVQSLLGKVPFAPTDFGTYCDTLSLPERTLIWLALEQLPALGQLLTAAGRGGVGHEAIERVRASAANKTRQTDRAAAVQRLLRAQTPSEADPEHRNVRRAASEFAHELLARETAGDVRTAADLMLWAGGPGHRHTASLRKAFTDSLDNYKDPLPKSHIAQLHVLNLITPPKKNFFGAILGR